MTCRTQPVVIGALLTFISGSAPALAGDPRIGTAWPLLPDHIWVEGPPVSIESGGRYAIYMWDHGCGPCVGLMPTFSTMRDTYASRGVTFFTLAGCRDHGHDRVMKLAKEKLANIPTACGEFIFGELAGTGIPEVILVGPNGEVVWADHPSALTDDIWHEFLSGRLERTIVGDGEQTGPNPGKLRYELALARGHGDEEMERAILKDLAAFGPAYRHYAVEFVRKSGHDAVRSPESVKAVEDYVASYFAEQGYQAVVFEAFYQDAVMRLLATNRVDVAVELLERLAKSGKGVPTALAGVYDIRASREGGQSESARKVGKRLLERFGDDADAMRSVLGTVHGNGQCVKCDAALGIEAAAKLEQAAGRLSAKELEQLAFLHFHTGDFAAAVAAQKRAIAAAENEAEKARLGERLEYYELKLARSGR